MTYPMRLSRRVFLKASCASMGALIGFGLLGCSSQKSATSSRETTEGEDASDKVGTGMASSSSSSESVDEGASADKVAVVYFSCTGNTKAVAEKVAEATCGTLMRIEPAEPYTSADLDYNADCRANAEQDSSNARPALALPEPDVADYSTIYLGYPIWWGKVPRIILTYLEGIDLSGKTIVPFCTSGSSPIDGSVAEIKQAAPGAVVLEGKRFPAGATQQQVTAWVDDTARG